MISQNDIPQQYGMDVYEQDGTKIGSIDEIYLDAQSGEPEWLAVKTGLFGLKQSFVPVQRAEVSPDRVVVPFGKEQVKDAPRIDPDGRLTPQQEDELYQHYGLTSGVIDPRGNEAHGRHAAPGRLRKHAG